MNYFMCPLTNKLFVNPVIAEDGFTYEQEAIKKWFEDGNMTSPVTCEAISTTLIPNNLIKTMNPQEIETREKELEKAAMKKQSEEITKLHAGKYTSGVVLGMLEEYQTFMRNLNNGKFSLKEALGEVQKLVHNLDDPDILEEYAILLLWHKESFIPEIRGIIKELRTFVSKDITCDFIETCLLNLESKKPEALELFKKTCESKEDNLFLVREIKFKAIALLFMGELDNSAKHFEAYEGLKPYQTNILACFRGSVMQKMKLHKQAMKYLSEYMTLYGKDIFVANLLLLSCTELNLPTKLKAIQKYLASLQINYIEEINEEEKKEETKEIVHNIKGQ